METVSIKEKPYSQLDSVALIVFILGIFISAILSNYLTTISLYTFYASLFILIFLVIKRILKQYEQLPLIELFEETIRVFKYKNRPFLGLTLSYIVDINWNDISKFSAAKFSGGHTVDKIWYCFEDNKRNIVENFIETKHTNEIMLLIELVKKNIDANKINLEAML